MCTLPGVAEVLKFPCDVSASVCGKDTRSAGVVNEQRRDVVGDTRNNNPCIIGRAVPRDFICRYGGKPSNYGA
jgi:hypothetical protein